MNNININNINVICERRKNSIKLFLIMKNNTHTTIATFM